jgi:hypothetical protein
MSEDSFAEIRETSRWRISRRSIASGETQRPELQACFAGGINRNLDTKFVCVDEKKFRHSRKRVMPSPFGDSVAASMQNVMYQ